MLWLVIIVLLFVLMLGPQWWVSYVLKRYSREIELPGTGSELAEHLLKRFELEDVVVEETTEGDHYDPADKAVRLSQNVYQGKSITAVATAAHEVGHAIAFCRNEPVTHLRQRYMARAIKLQKAGAMLLMLLPILVPILHIPHAILITALIGILTMLVSVLMYVAILPEEWDASFNKALPILIEGQYVSPAQHEAVRRVLKACALTYVAAALADVLRLWRWIAILRAGR